MDLSIVIVSWQVKDFILKCLASIQENKNNLDLEIFVVDNNSKDGTAEMVKKEFPQVNLIANQKNLGFAKANNQAIKVAKGDYVLLLNPDTEIKNNALKKTITFMAKQKNTGILGCRLLNADGSLQMSVRRFPTIRAIALIFFKLPKIFPNLPAIKNYLAANFNYQKTQSVDQVMGAFMLIKKEVFAKIGLLDENFFIWFEEVDFCRRARKAGYKTCYYVGAEIIHHGGQSFAQKTTLKNQWNFFRSAVRYFLKKI